MNQKIVIFFLTKSLVVIIYYYGLLRKEKSTIRGLIKEGASLKDEPFKVGMLLEKFSFFNKKL